MVGKCEAHVMSDSRDRGSSSCSTSFAVEIKSLKLCCTEEEARKLAVVVEVVVQDIMYVMVKESPRL